MSPQQLLSQHPSPEALLGRWKALDMNGVIKAPCPGFLLSESLVFTAVSSQIISTNLSTQIPGFLADTGGTAPLGAKEVQSTYQSTFEIYASAQCKKQTDAHPQ